MDIFKQKRFLWGAIIVLVVMNITTLTLLWLGNPQRRAVIGDPEQEQARIQHVLRQELGFDDEQIKSFMQLRQQHRRKMDKVVFEMNQLKREMIDQVIMDEAEPMLSDSLLQLVQDKQAMIEKLTFEHVVELKKLCTSEQQTELLKLMHAMLPRPPKNMDRRPPMPDGNAEMPPRRPDSHAPNHRPPN